MALAKITASDVAKYFVSKADPDAGDHITHLKLQKLLYFAQAYHLANFDDSLFCDDFEAWPHGPVCQAVWLDYKQYSYNPIPLGAGAKITDKSICAYLDAVWEKFGVFSAKKLEQMTHDHAPWRDARGALSPEQKCNNVITKETMKSFYGQRIKKKK